MPSRTRAVLVPVIVLVCATLAPAGPIWDVKKDWKDGLDQSRNPNLPWTYRAGVNTGGLKRGDLLVWKQEGQWDSGPSYAYSLTHDVGGFLASAAKFGGRDSENEQVGGHGPFIVRWSSPVAGWIRISGYFYQSESLRRLMHWSLFKNDDLLTDGFMPHDRYGSRSGFEERRSFAESSIEGELALYQQVKVGDDIDLLIDGDGLLGDATSTGAMVKYIIKQIEAGEVPGQDEVVHKKKSRELARKPWKDREISPVTETLSVTPIEREIDTETRVDLKRSIELACQNMIEHLNPSDGYMPLFLMSLNVAGDGKVRGCFTPNAPFHNIGRWWDAMLRAEDAIGFAIPSDVEAGFLATTRRLSDNPYHVFLRGRTRAGDPRFCDHSFREILSTWNALVRFRNSQWALGKGEGMIESLLSGATPLQIPHHITSGRFLESLVWFHETTGSSRALVLAEKLARANLEDSTASDGAMTLISGHTHSYMGTLRGLLRYGELTNQSDYMERVAVTYGNAVREMTPHSGFLPHDINGERGETGSSSDVAQLALWLGTRHGYPEFLDDVERIVRVRLLPSQILPGECPPIAPDEGLASMAVFPNGEAVPTNAEASQNEEKLKDLTRNLDRRIVGAYGGVHQQPHGHKISTLDVTAANVHSLVDIYDHIVVRDDTGIKVYFHFDYESELIEIESVRSKTARVTIRPKIGGENVLVRIPRWAPAASVRVSVNGKLLDLEKRRIGDFVLISKKLLPGEIVLTHDLPVSIRKERTGGVEYTFLWRGDEVMGISPNDGILPFYPTLDLER